VSRYPGTPSSRIATRIPDRCLLESECGLVMRVDLLHGLRSVFCTFKRNMRTKSLVKIIMYNTTCTISHKDVEEYLVPFPPIAHLTSGPNNGSSRPSCPAIACDCSHWPSSSGVSFDARITLDSSDMPVARNLDSQRLTGLARPDLNRFVTCR